MLFRQIVLAALCVGLFSGLMLTLVQQFQVSPLILAAEEYEVPTGEHDSHQHGSSAGHDSWSPDSALERLAYSLLSNVLASIGLAMVLISLMTQYQLRASSHLTPAKGMAWGVAAFVVFFVAPGLGLPAEIPGMQSAPIANRQTWWVLTVLATGVGCALLVFAPRKVKAIGIVLLLLPHLVGAPQFSGSEFLQTNPDTVAILSHLHHEFIIASTVSNLVFWLVMGILSAIILQRWVLKNVAYNR